MYKFSNTDGYRVFPEAKDLIQGLRYKGSSYSGVCSDKGIKLSYIKGKSVQNFGGGVVEAPTPTNPVPIESVEVQSVVSYGDNILSDVIGGWARATGSYDGTTGVLVMTPTGTGPYINEVTSTGSNYEVWQGPLYSIPDYINELYFKSQNGVFNSTLATFYDSGKKSLGYKTINSGGQIPTVIPASAKYFTARIGIQPENATVGQTYKDKISLSFSPISEWIGPYYKEIETNFALYSLPDGLCDEYLGDGKVLRRVYKKVLNGTEVWYNWGDSTKPFTCSDTNFKSSRNSEKANALSDKLTVESLDTQWMHSENTNNFGIGNGTAYNIRIRINGITSIDALKSYLASNPITIIGERTTPIIEAVNIPTLPTKAPKANAFIQTNLDTEVEWDILTNSNNDLKIDELIKRIEALESAVAGG